MSVPLRPPIGRKEKAIAAAVVAVLAAISAVIATSPDSGESASVIDASRREVLHRRLEKSHVELPSGSFSEITSEDATKTWDTLQP